ncbi:MAG: hypothetical protein ABI402_08700 [Ferruginibacter sp.]
MKYKIINSVLLVVIMLNCNFCFGQIENLRFIIDTTLSKDSGIHEFDFYRDSVIRGKSFYTSKEDKVHFEYLKLEPNKFYCFEYDTTGKKTAEGVVKKEARPYDIIEMSVYDSNGNIIGVKKTDQFKFCRDEYWIENIKADGEQESGKYINGLKDSLWVQYKNFWPEKDIFYRKGIVVKEVMVNIAGTTDKRVKEFLTRKWKVLEFSRTPTQQFIPSKENDNDYNSYVYLKSNDSCQWYTNHGRTNKKGSWKLIENNMIEIKLETGKVFLATIDYLSEYGLSLTFK